MAFIRLDRDAFENATVSLRPNVHFISSSIGQGVIGSQFVSPVRSKCIKRLDFSQEGLNDLEELHGKFNDGTLTFDASNSNRAFDESDAYILLDDFGLQIINEQAVNQGLTDLTYSLDRYMKLF